MLNTDCNTETILILSEHAQFKKFQCFQSTDHSNVYNTNIPSKARLGGATAKAVISSTVHQAILQHQQAINWCLWGKPKSKKIDGQSLAMLPQKFDIDYFSFYCCYLGKLELQSTMTGGIDQPTILGPTINQSINQSNFYSAIIPSKARLSGVPAKSVFNSKIEETVP